MQLKTSKNHAGKKKSSDWIKKKKQIIQIPTIETPNKQQKEHHHSNKSTQNCTPKLKILTSKVSP